MSARKEYREVCMRRREYYDIISERLGSKGDEG